MGTGAIIAMSFGLVTISQLVSLQVDAAGVPHLTFRELTQASPLNGLIV